MFDKTVFTYLLTHWDRATHICVGNLTIIGSDNGLSSGRRQAIIWTNDGILLIRPLGKSFSEISIEILTFSFKKVRLKLSSAKWWPFCLGLNVLISMLWHRQAICESKGDKFLCYMLDSNPGSLESNLQQNEWLLTNRLSYRGSS